MMSIIKNKSILKKILIFLVFFVISFVAIHYYSFFNGYGDPMNSYGFSKAIMMGQVPYRDFNTISTPLYAMYQSLFLFIYDNFIMINISQAILISISCMLIYKMFGKRSFTLLLVVSIFLCKNLVATYNFMSLFMIIVLIYMEKEHSDKDFLIGILLALSVFSKQTVGCFMLIPSFIFYFKKKDKLLKRCIGFLIPCFVFLIYLLVNKALYSFFDLCLFGLFDFMNNNGVGGGHINYVWLILTAITFCFALIILFKNKKDISNYYLICGILIVFPLFDITHFSFWLTCFVIMLLPFIKKYEKYIIMFSIVCSFVFTLFVLGIWFPKLDLCITKNLKHYSHNVHLKNNYKNLTKINKIFNEYEDPIVLGYQSMFYLVENDKPLTFFSVLYDGNYGFNGIAKMKKKIDKIHDRYFIISVTDYESDDEFSQLSKSLIKYAMDNSKFIKEESGFWIYYKE